MEPILLTLVSTCRGWLWAQSRCGELRAFKSAEWSCRSQLELELRWTEWSCQDPSRQLGSHLNETGIACKANLDLRSGNLLACLQSNLRVDYKVLSSQVDLAPHWRHLQRFVHFVFDSVQFVIFIEQSREPSSWICQNLFCAECQKYRFVLTSAQV